MYNFFFRDIIFKIVNQNFLLRTSERKTSGESKDKKMSDNKFENVCESLNADSTVANFDGNWRGWGIPDVESLTTTKEGFYDLLVRADLAFTPLIAPVTFYNIVTGKTETFGEKYVILNGKGESLAVVGEQLVKSLVVGGHYETVEKLIGEIVNVGGIPARAISFAQGARALIQLAIPESYYVAGIEHKAFYSVYNAIDGSSKTLIGWTQYTPICANTKRAAFDEIGTNRSAKHTQNFAEKLSSIQRQIFGIKTEIDEFFTGQKKLATIPTDSEIVKAFTQYLIPDVPQKAGSDRKVNTGPSNRRGELVKAIETSLAEREAKDLTIYDLLRGTTRYTTYRKDDPEYAFFGPGSDLNDRAHAWAEKNYL